MKSFWNYYQSLMKHIDLENLSFPLQSIPYEKGWLIRSRRSVDLVVENLYTSLPGHVEENGPLQS